MAYNYPYGNGQQLNLDWFLNEWKNLLAAWEAEKNGIDGALQAEIDRAEAALADVFAARDAAAQSAANALESKNAAAQSASDASGYLSTVQQNATAAQDAARNAAQSESNAADSAQTAVASKNAAGQSERNAAQSEANALAYKDAAAQSASAAADSQTAAGNSASAAAQSAEDAENASASIEASAQQIATNASNISNLKESLAYNTVSGDVVWFDDAQDSPVANISVDNEATVLNRFGTNLIFDNTILTGQIVGVRSVANNNGSITITGTVETAAWVFFGQYKTLSELGLQVGMPITASINDVSPKAGLSIWFEDSNGNRLQMLETQSSDNNIASTIIPENTARLRILLYPQAQSISAIGTVFNVTLFPQIEIGKSATPFQKGVKKQYSISNGTPTEQVTTLEGKNSFWADVGNVNIKYLLDIKKYVDNKIAEIQATILENIGG